MNKILLATTMLVGFAGVAAAESHITLSGDARMGIIKQFGEDDAAFTSRARVKFTMTGNTDGGLEFGASFRADNAGDAAGGMAGEVHISGAFGKLSMGDVDGAALAAVGHVDGVGLTGLGDLNESTYLSGMDASESVLYEYSTGNLGFFVSSGQVGNDGSTTYAGQDVLAVGASFSGEMFSVSLGYETASGPVDADHIIVGASASFSNVTLKAIYGTADMGATDGDQFAVSATYAADAFAATIFMTDDEELGGVEAMGIGGSYDLGGGAKVVGGYVKDQTNDDDAFDLGIAMEF